MLKQKEVRFNAICAIRMPVDSKVTLTGPEIEHAALEFAHAIKSGDCEMKAESIAKYDTLDKLVKYCKGSIRDCLLKDVRVNGGNKHTAAFKRPRDEELKSLNLLFTQYLDQGRDEEAAIVEQAIIKRKAAIEADKPASQRKKEVDYGILSDELKKKLNIA